MAITKEIKINYINVQELKTLQIMGSTIIKDGEEVLAEKEYAFGLQPNQNPSDFSAYVNLPTSEKAKVDELVTALWTDAVKDNYATFLASQQPVTEDSSE
tara:strand:+ start:288 stop:587 length:300 start_codon:yes stop_codon:yes gene_type:complete